MLKDLARRARSNIVALTHLGRRSGKRYTTKLWYVVIDDDVWIGSLCRDRAWVRNARAAGRAELDFGGGARSVELEWCTDPLDIARYRAAINRKHWLLGPILQRLVSGTPCAFRARLLHAQAENERPLPAGVRGVAGGPEHTPPVASPAPVR